jgi:hypothetical protein
MDLSLSPPIETAPSISFLYALSCSEGLIAPCLSLMLLLHVQIRSAHTLGFKTDQDSVNPCCTALYLSYEAD